MRFPYHDVTMRTWGHFDLEIRKKYIWTKIAQSLICADLIAI